jgi:acyl carrier protein
MQRFPGRSLKAWEKAFEPAISADLPRITMPAGAETQRGNWFAIRSSAQPSNTNVLRYRCQPICHEESNMKKQLSDQELYSEVEKVICNVFRLNGSAVRPDTTLVGDLGAESIDFLDLGCDLEKIVDAEVDFRKLFQEKRAQAEGNGVLDVTVQEVVDYLKIQAGAQEAEATTVQ